MRIWLAAILLGVSLSACRRSELRTANDHRESQIVALSVRSEPPGAKVKVNQIPRTWTTPCDIADFSIQRGPIDVELTLQGYEPLKKQVQYDGSNPLQLQLQFDALEKAPIAAVPAAPQREPSVEPAAKPAPVQVVATPGGTRLKVTSKDVKVRIQAKMVVTDPEKPGEYFLPNAPPEKVIVEFLDPKTDVVLHAVEFAPSPAPEASVKAPAPKEAAASGADRVGEVKVVSKTYGVFVKLDPGLSLQPGEEILVYRDGKEVARSKILKITKGDAAYPDGAAQVQKDGPIQKGDEVRRPKP